MSRRLRRALSIGSFLLVGLAVASPVAAHPLGNFTVNRAISVVIDNDGLEIGYVTDLAEIPAFAALQAMDNDGSGSIEAGERAAYAPATCASARAGLSLQIDGAVVELRDAGEPLLSFPPGAGGLETLRLVCPLRADVPAGAGEHRLSLVDRVDDGHLGWHEVVISAGVGVSLSDSNVVTRSPTALLTAYPTASLDAPLDVRSGEATWRVGAGQAAAPIDQQPGPGTPRSSTSDPLAALANGPTSLPAVILGVLLAIGLGAIHAISPGHGKTLVAAYLIGSRGSLRQAAGLGLTVAATHTAGVFVLGLVMLLAGQFLVPERVIGWLSAGSGLLVVGLGVGLVLQTIRRPAHRHGHSHLQGHASDDGHVHDHGHDHGPGHPHQTGRDAAPLRARNVIALGLAGGMVPSASALIVLLVAVSTGRLVLGLALIVAFGIGMAAVLGGLAVAAIWLRAAVLRGGGLARHPLAGRLAGWLPLASGTAVTMAGVVLALSAVARLA